jgi:hypothetical protein
VNVDPKAFGKEMSEIVRAFVARELGPLQERAASLEARLARAEERIASLEAGHGE